MAGLVSPGVSISVIDESINVGSGPGTVPLIVIATASNKFDPSGLAIAQGTLPQYAGKMWSITSQRDLVQTFGEPHFYSVSGTPLNGYPLNEYGLLASYSYLGLANLARVIRADIDLSQLRPLTLPPITPATPGTLWFNQTPPPNGSSYGLFKIVGSNWVSVTMNYIWNGTLTVPGAPDPDVGVDGNFGLTYDSTTGTIAYWEMITSTWTQLGSTVGTQMVFQDVWPDVPTAITDGIAFWVKTNSPAQGANLVLDVFDSTVGNFIQVEAPILADDSAANAYYAGLSIVGRYYIEPITSDTTVNEFQFRVGTSGGWIPAAGIIASNITPTNGPTEGMLWYNSLVGLYSDGKSTVDIMVNNGTGAWANVNLPGYSIGLSGAATLYPQSQDPRNNVPTVTLHPGDLWLVTDIVDTYPVIYKWTGSAWNLVDNTDQTTPNGIIFKDARPVPGYFANGSTSHGTYNGGGSNPDLDPDAPNAALYPKGFLLWNTRYSSDNVKEWVDPFIFEGNEAALYNGSHGRWVNKSGNRADGSPYMGQYAQQIVVSNSINHTIASSDDIRADDVFYNLIAAPGYVEAIQSMLELNEDRKETAFVVGDSPMQLPPNGISLQAWATNAAHSVDNSEAGLVSASRFLGIWYPSGITVNPADGTDVVVPPSHMALHTIAYNDQVAYPWFAPAGLQRGIVANAATVGYVNNTGEFTTVRLNEGQRDILYSNGINPIRIMPNGGIVLYGQKDRQPFASALDRINVVRLENYLRYQLNQLAQPWLFEPNDKTTRAAVTNSFTNFMSELVTLRALTDFLIVCNDSNNTPERIDRNELWIDCAILPTRAIEFIYIPIRIKNTGASLTTP